METNQNILNWSYDASDSANIWRIRIFWTQFIIDFNWNYFNLYENRHASLSNPKKKYDNIIIFLLFFTRVLFSV